MSKKSLFIFFVLLVLGAVAFLAIDEDTLAPRAANENGPHGLLRARVSRALEPPPGAVDQEEKSESESLYVLTEVARIADKIEKPTDEPDRSTEELARLGATLGAGEIKQLRDLNLRAHEPFIERYIALSLLKAAPETETKTAALADVAASPAPERSENPHTAAEAAAMQEHILRRLAMDALAAHPSTSIAIRSLEQVAAAQTNGHLKRQATLLAELLRRGELDDYRRQEENILAHAADSE